MNSTGAGPGCRGLGLGSAATEDEAGDGGCEAIGFGDAAKIESVPPVVIWATRVGTGDFGAGTLV